VTPKILRKTNQGRQLPPGGSRPWAREETPARAIAGYRRPDQQRFAADRAFELGKARGIAQQTTAAVAIRIGAREMCDQAVAADVALQKVREFARMSEE